MGYRNPKIGDRPWFEYHCLESHDSSDAEAWYRSHQKVLVIGVTEPGYGGTRKIRGERGQPRVYRVRWEDGFEYDVFEDELVWSASEFFRPAPPPKPSSKRRPNPPKDINSLNVLGGECSVWAIAAATGTSVPDVRRAFMEAGEDIWKKRGGMGSGASMRQIRAVIKKLDWDRRIVGIGAAEMFGNGPRAKFTDRQSRLFLSGRDENEIGADQFDVPDQLKADAARYGSARAAVKATDDMATVGQLVDQARKDGLALLAVTVHATRARVSAHIVGYSPAKGFYDTSEATLAARKRFVHGGKDETITGLEWFAHGEDVPGRSRRAVLWVMFRGE